MTPKQNTENNKAKLSQAYADFEKSLKSRAYYKVSDHDLSQDLVQQTFTKTWLYLVKNGKIENMKAFLYHILNNLIIDQYRKQKTTSLDTLLEIGYEPSENKVEKMIDVMDGKSALLLIKKLPIKYKKIMNMRYIQDLSLKEISLIMKTTKNNISVQIHRAILKIQSMYGIF